MSHPVIEVNNLGKRYIIGHQINRVRRTRTLSELITKSVRSIGRRLRPFGEVHESERGRWEEFWALRDIGFELRNGDTLGIIGHNGAGKSTLLKILSRITEPTTGTIRIRGRVASLLEVGTGFHPEMTGRENVYLNGSILGMSKAEISRKFDEIVSFAEIEQFIDTPVKRYSSGMYVRLAFSVAAHLEPEILVVDEVLAVGDIRFQKKCLGKMSDVTRKDGRTILFVSHNMAAITALCSRGILLKGGRLMIDGTAREAVELYQKTLLEKVQEEDHSDRVYTAESIPAGIKNICADLLRRDDAEIDLDVSFDVFSEIMSRRLEVGIEIVTRNGVRVAFYPPKLTNFGIEDIRGCVRVRFLFPEVGRYLAGGDYFVSLILCRPGEKLLNIESATKFSIPPRDFFQSGVYFEQEGYGVTPLPLKFSIVENAEKVADVTYS